MISTKLNQNQRGNHNDDFFTLLNDILSTAMDKEDMSSILGVLANRMGELFNADDCYITFWDEENRTTIPMVAYGDLSDVYTSVHRFMNEERTLTAVVLDSGQPVAIDDLKHSDILTSDLVEEFPNLAALGLPLISGKRKLGAVILGYDQIHAFQREEIERAALAARQISLAITKSILLEDARQRVEELAGMHAISQSFSLSGEASSTYGTLTSTLARLTGAQTCVISLIDFDTRIVYAQVPAYGLSDEQVSTFRYSIEQGKQAWDFSSRDGMFIVNSEDEIPAGFEGLTSSLGMKSLLVAPLWDANRLLFGMIYLGNKPGGFGEADCRRMEIFIPQVVGVVQNIRLLATERMRSEQLAALHAVATASTEADDEDQLIERVTQQIGNQFSPECYGILLQDEGAGELYLHGSYHRGEYEIPVRQSLEENITGIVAKNGSPLLVDDFAKISGYTSQAAAMRSGLCVPLRAEDKLLGVIHLESTVPNAFNREDAELLTIIAGQMAMAIQGLRAAQAEHHQTQQLERANALIRALAQVNARASAAADLDNVLQTLGNELSKLGLRCVAALSDTGNHHVVIRYISLPDSIVRVLERLGPTNSSNFAIPVERLSKASGLSQTSSLLNNPTELITTIVPSFSPRLAGKILDLVGVTASTPVCNLPLVAEGRPLGILWMWAEGLQKSDLPTLSLFASQVAATLQSANLLAEVRRLARTDPLTGLFNRRFFFELAEKEFSRSSRYHRQLSALILDIDHFKQFNDRYGHLVGDQVLKGVADLMTSALRKVDILGRYGGEEFAILLPETDGKMACKFAERLLSKVANVPIPTDAGELSVQLSIGVAGYEPGTASLHDLVNKADQAMYLAKEGGRNRVAAK
jgi:diguanylate cyclase (GGDEF)-like protein